VIHVGPSGSAVTMKIAVNLSLAAQMLAFSEGVLLAEKTGIPRAKAVEVMLASVIASPIVAYRGPLVLGDPDGVWFDCHMMQKDLNLALELGRQLEVPLPTTAVTSAWGVEVRSSCKSRLRARRSGICTPRAQQARQLAWGLGERSIPVRFLIRDRDSTFTREFDAVFRSEGVEIVRTPVRAPKANAIAERFVRTIRAECLDWLLIINHKHLEHVLRVFVEHQNGHRPHRAHTLKPPDPRLPTLRLTPSPPPGHVERQDRLGGLIHEYQLAA
jgi:hypothetical protein